MAKKKFVEEARAIAQMDHDNIIKVQALFEENDTAYYRQCAGMYKKTSMEERFSF